MIIKQRQMGDVIVDLDYYEEEEENDDRELIDINNKSISNTKTHSKFFLNHY